MQIYDICSLLNPITFPSPFLKKFQHFLVKQLSFTPYMIFLRLLIYYKQQTPPASQVLTIQAIQNFTTKLNLTFPREPALCGLESSYYASCVHAAGKAVCTSRSRGTTLRERSRERCWENKNRQNELTQEFELSQCSRSWLITFLSYHWVRNCPLTANLALERDIWNRIWKQ